MTRKMLIGVGYLLFLGTLVCCSSPEEPAVPLIILTPGSGFDDLVPEEEPTMEPEYVEVEPQAQQIADDPRPFTFVAQPGESVGLYSDWTKLEVEELLSGLKIASPRYLKAGAEYTLVMTPERWEGFAFGRSERERKRRVRFFEKKYIVHYRTHVIRSGETPGSICRKYEIPLWLLEETNQNMEPASLTAGEEVDVPIVAEKDGSEPVEVLRPTLVPARGEVARVARAPQTPEPVGATPPTLVPASVPKVEVEPSAPEDNDEEAQQEERDDALAPNLLRIRIKRGETLGDLAEMGELNVDTIIELNQISNPNILRVGQEIALPITPDKWPDFLLARERRSLLITAIQSYERRGFQVIKEPLQQGETAYAVAERVGAERSSLALLNPAQNFDDLKPGQQLRFAVPKGTSDAETN